MAVAPLIAMTAIGDPCGIGTEVAVRAVQGGFQFGRPWFYLQTDADSADDNNLNELPECPRGAGVVEIWF